MRVVAAEAEAAAAAAGVVVAVVVVVVVAAFRPRCDDLKTSLRAKRCKHNSLALKNHEIHRA